MASADTLPSVSPLPAPISRPATDRAGGRAEEALTLSGDARGVRVDDYLIVLDRRRGTYSSFNLTGALVWKQLERGAGATQIAESLARDFDIPVEHALGDVTTMLESLRRSGLVVSAREAGAPRSEAASPPCSELAESVARQLFEVPEKRRPRAGAASLLHALAVLARIDVAMRTSGLGRLERMIAGRDRVAQTLPPVSRVWSLIDAADRAAALYFKQAWCLQRSAACAYVLRRRGVPAELVIGVHPSPFFAHAWVEIGGRAVNEPNTALLRLLTVIDRC